MLSLLETQWKLRLGAKSLLEDRALKDSFACLVCKLHLKLLQIKKKKEISLDTRSLELPLDTLSWMGEGRGEANLSPNSVINYNSL